MKNNMKVFKIFLFVFAIGAIALTSCKKEELVDTNYPNPTPPVSDLGELTCFVSEGTWEANTYTASFANDMIVIEAVSVENDTMTFSIKYRDGQYYYPFGAANTDFAIFKNHVDVTAYYSTLLADAADGEIGHINLMVDTTNYILSGSFAFKAYKTTDGSEEIITEGNFKNIRYKDPDNTQNTMSAIVENDTINAFTTVIASKNIINVFDVRGYKDDIILRMVFYKSSGIVAGDSISFSDSDNAAYYDQGSGFAESTNGYVKILQFNDSTNTMRADFAYNIGTDSIKSGQFNVVYFEQ